MISVGTVLGGPEQNGGTVDLALRVVAKAAIAERGESKPRVNVVFYVPGSLNTPNFKQMRTGRFSRKEGMLMVQVPLPAFVHSEPGEQVTTRLLQEMRDALSLASEYLRKKRVDFSLSDGLALVERIAAHVG